ncbi:MAG: GNAT family N-acetyltransferase [Sneathiella sp.]
MMRHYTEEDTDALLEIWRKANTLAHPFLEEAFVKQVAKDMRCIYLPNAETWVMEEEGRPIGFIALVKDEIGGLFLDPDFHGNGFGKALVDHALSLKGTLSVEVFEKNRIGRRFYERYGFIETDRYLHDLSAEVTLKMRAAKQS